MQQRVGTGRNTRDRELPFARELSCLLFPLLISGCSSESSPSVTVIDDAGDGSSGFEAGVNDDDGPTTLPRDLTLYGFLQTGDIDGDGRVDVGGTGLSRLAAAVDRVPSLAALLADESRTLTLLAPTDDAFATSSLFIENFDSSAEIAQLEARLRQHIIQSNVDATAAMSLVGTRLPTVDGLSLMLSQGPDGSLQVIDGEGRAVPLDVARSRSASNGTLYLIDTLLASVDVGDDSATGDDDETMPPPAPGDLSATDVIRATPELSEFAALLSVDSFDITLASAVNNPFIIIAPSNGNLRIGSSTVTRYLRSHIINLPSLNNLLVPGTHSSTANTPITVAGTASDLNIDGAPLRLLAGPGTRGGSVYVLDGEIPEPP